MVKIACWGYYGKHNLGDDLILSELLTQIKKSVPNGEITVFASSDEMGIPKEDKHIKRCERTVKNLLRASFLQDVLICGPGGIMPQRSTRKLCLWVVLALILKLRRRSVLFLGMGIGRQNFQKLQDRLLLRLLTVLSDSFVVRQLGVNVALNTGKVREAADVVFAADFSDTIAVEKKQRTIVFSLAQIFGGTTDRECQRFVDGMASSINNLMKQEWQIHFVEFTKPHDMYVYDEILRKLDNPGDVVIHHYTGDPYSMVDVFRQSQISVCMRFHALVLSAMAETPCAIISYSDKMDDVAERLGIEEYVVQICPQSNLYYERLISFDEERFRLTLEQVIRDETAIRSCLKQQVPELTAYAQINWDALSETLMRYNERM